jgi:small subunit ribosomal protein S20
MRVRISLMASSYPGAGHRVKLVGEGLWAVLAGPLPAVGGSGILFWYYRRLRPVQDAQSAAQTDSPGIASAEEEPRPMPNLKSAKKRVRIEEKRRARNKAVKSTVRTYVTKARNAIAEDPSEPQTEEAIREAVSQLDRAVSKGVLHRNNASRRKSRLMHRLHAAQSEA